MKKHFFLLCLLALTLGLATSCYDDSELRERVDKLENSAVATINQQLASLQSSVNLLKQTDEALQSTITTLQGTVGAQQTDIDDLKAKEGELSDQIAALQNQIDALSTWVENALNDYATKDDLTTQLTAIQDHITETTNGINDQFAAIQQQFDAINAQLAKLMAVPGITFEEGDTILYQKGGVEFVVNYTLTGADVLTTVECLADAGWQAVVTAKGSTSGTIAVTPPAEGGNGKVIVLVAGPTTTIMRVLRFEQGTIEVPDEERYTFIGTWPQSATDPGARLCNGELSSVMGKISGNTYSAQSRMGSAFLRDHRATEEEMAWLADYTAKPAQMDGFSRWAARRIPNLYPFGDPKPADCNQHAIGDCNTVSTLSTMAYLYPGFIKSLITVVSDTEYQVKMFDPDGKRIIVGVDNQILLDNNSSIAQMTGKNLRITWATILEKAIMKWLYVFRPGHELGGFGAEGMTPLFTGDGRSFAVSPGRCTPEELKLFVTTCLQHGLIVNGGFNKQGLKMGNHETITAHGHSFFMANDPNALFAIRNPWGQGSDDHVMQCYDADHAPAGYDGTIPSTIDLRIISPGIAALYYEGPIQPYTIPKW